MWGLISKSLLAVLCNIVLLTAATAKTKVPKCPKNINPTETRVEFTNLGPQDGLVSIQGRTKCKNIKIADTTGIDLDSNNSQAFIDFLPGLYTFCIEYEDEFGTLVRQKEEIAVNDLDDVLVEFDTSLNAGKVEVGQCIEPPKPKPPPAPKVGKNKVPACEDTAGPTNITVSNFGVVDASVSVSARLSCEDDFIAPGLSAAIFTTSDAEFVDMPPGLYTFCASWNGDIVDVNGTLFQQKRHKTIKRTLTGSAVSTAEASVSFSPCSSCGKKGPCEKDPGVVEGRYEGRGTVTKGGCAGGNFSFSVNEQNKINGTLVDDLGINYNITGKYNSVTGRVRGTYKNAAFPNGKYRGFIDAGKGAGKFTNSGPGFKCSGNFALTKVGN